MKRILNAKTRQTVKKKSLTHRRRFFKTIKNTKRPYIPIDSPYNSNEYLIQNDSSPFEDDEDFEDCFDPSPLNLGKEISICDETALEVRKFSSFSTQNESLIEEPHLKMEKMLLV